MKNLPLAAAAFLAALSVSSAHAADLPVPSVQLPEDCGETALGTILPVANAYFGNSADIKVTEKDVTFSKLKLVKSVDNHHDGSDNTYSANYAGKVVYNTTSTAKFSGKVLVTTTRGGCMLDGFEFGDM